MAGLAAGVGQVLVFRELIVSCQGNEVTMGIMLAAWLVWGALGTALIGRWARSVSLTAAVGQMAVLAALPGAGLLAALVIARSFGYLLAVVIPGLLPASGAPGLLLLPGQMLGIHHILALGFIATLVPAAVAGAQFAAGCRAYTHPDLRVAGTVGSTYGLDAVGHLIGGTALGWLALQVVDPFTMAVIAGLGNLLVGLAIIWINIPLDARRRTLALGAMGLAALVTVLFAVTAQPWSVTARWYHHQLLDSRRTIYGDLAITKFGEQGIYLYNNGLPSASSPAPQSLQLAVDFALLQHPQPDRILLVGGGVTGGLAAVLRHHPHQIDYLELDPAIFSFVGPWLASEDRAALADQRVHCISGDARLFVKHTAGQAARPRYDVVLLLLPAPATAQLNRFYTRQWYEQVRGILAPDGLLAWQLPSSAVYLQGPLRQLDALVYSTARDVFGAVTFLPGEEMTLVASASPDYFTQDWAVLFERARRRGLDSDIFWAWLPDKLDPFTVGYVREQLEGAAEMAVNTDERPLAYFHHQAWWVEHLHRGWGRRLSGIAHLPLAWLWGAVVVLAGIWGVLSLTRPGQTYTIPVAVAAVGMGGMAGEVVLLLAFQCYYGYVYQQIGIIVGSFMMGLAVASWWVGRWLRQQPPHLSLRHWLAGILAAGAVLVAIMPYALKGLWTYATTPAAEAMVAHLLFPLLSALLGLWIGGQFPLASHLWTAFSGSQAWSAAFLYAADLLGAAAGALIAGTLLVPIWGVANTCWLMAAPALVASVLVLRSRTTAGG